MAPALGVIDYSVDGAAAAAAALLGRRERGRALPTPWIEMDWEGTVAEKGSKGHLRHAK